MTDAEREARLMVSKILARDHGIRESDWDVENFLANYFERGWLNDGDVWKAVAEAIRKQKRKIIEVLEDKLKEYGVHESDCICSQWRQGEPTVDGGYRSLYGYGKYEKWYQRGETPKCTCGFSEALEQVKKMRGERDAVMVEKFEPASTGKKGTVSRSHYNGKFDVLLESGTRLLVESGEVKILKCDQA